VRATTTAAIGLKRTLHFGTPDRAACALENHES
jgi:hypothetical protein